jgi:hypothetical protein
MQFTVESLKVDLPNNEFQSGVYEVLDALVEFRRLTFDLNNSDSSDDEFLVKRKRFDLNDSDSSDDESPGVGRLSMLQGGPSSQDIGQATVTDEADNNIVTAAVKAANAARDIWHAPGNAAKAALPSDCSSESSLSESSSCSIRSAHLYRYAAPSASPSSALWAAVVRNLPTWRRRLSREMRTPEEEDAAEEAVLNPERCARSFVNCQTFDLFSIPFR